MQSHGVNNGFTFFTHFPVWDGGRWLEPFHTCKVGSQMGLPLGGGGA